jgi:hypothetical protein
VESQGNTEKSCKTDESTGGVTLGYPKVDMNADVKAPRKSHIELGVTQGNRVTPEGNSVPDLTPTQRVFVQNLEAEGMSHAAAVAAALEFDHDDGSDDNYAKHTDDNADDNRHADDNADDNFTGSSADTPHSNGVSDDNGSDGRYFGDSLGSHTLIKKEEGRQGESNTDLSSASSALSSASFTHGTDRSQLALEALADESSGVRETVVDCLDGKYDKDHKTGASVYQGGSLGVVAGALAKYHGEARAPGAWKDWMEAASLLVDAVANEEEEEE